MDLPALAVLARAPRAELAKMPGLPPEAQTPITRQADAVAEMERVAEQLEWQRPLLSAYLARDLLGRVWGLRVAAPAIDLEQERALNQAAEDIRADASEVEFGGVDNATRKFLRDLPANERRNVRKKLAALIAAIAVYVFDHLTEKTESRNLIRLVAVLYALMGLYKAMTRAVDAVDDEDKRMET